MTSKVYHEVSRRHEMMMFRELFPNEEQYPENIAERGVPQDTYFQYVSHTFLDGIINYTEVCKGWLVITSGSGSTADHYSDDVAEIEHLSAVYNHQWHSTFSIFAHTKAYVKVVILASTENSHWFFYYDPDVSDCSIGRCNKERVSDEQFAKGMYDWLEDQGHYFELKRISGWMGWHR